jgi:CRISPR system Cascade subunit CasA
MDLLADRWLPTGTREVISPLQIGDRRWRDLRAPRADYLGALFQFLVGVLQTTYAPRDIGEWCERWSRPPSVSELETAFAPWREAFLLHRDGPAFMQDLQLPADANRQPVLDLLIDAGSDSNRFFNRPDAGLGMCLACFAQAILTLQINAPAGGRGVRTSLRGGGPLTTLLLPADESATLWHKLWLNVLPLDALGYPPVEQVGDVLPWMVPTRTSDGSDASCAPAAGLLGHAAQDPAGSGNHGQRRLRHLWRGQRRPGPSLSDAPRRYQLHWQLAPPVDSVHAGPQRTEAADLRQGTPGRPRLSGLVGPGPG